MEEPQKFDVVYNVAAARQEDYGKDDFIFPRITMHPYQLRLNPRNQVRRQSETFRTYKNEEFTRLIYDIVKRSGRRSNFLLSKRNMLRPPKRLRQSILETILREG